MNVSDGVNVTWEMEIIQESNLIGVPTCEVN